MQWEEWLTELITYFRKEHSSLSKAQRKYISNLDNFEYPCQVDVLSVRNEQLDSHYQVLIFTHFNDEPDLSFHIYDTSEPYRFSEIAVKMLEEPKWHKKLPRTEPHRFMKKIYRYQTYHDYLVDVLSNQHTMMKQYFSHICLKVPIVSRASSPGKLALFNEAGNSMWDVWGDITTVNPREIVDNIIEEAKLRPAVTAQRHKRSAEKKEHKKPRGYGALIFPRVWIGKLPEQSLKDRIERNYWLAKTLFHARYKGAQVLVRQDGFIGILFDDYEADDTSYRSKSLELLNEIVATCVLFGLPFHAIREPDLAEITVDPSTFHITGMSWRTSTFGDPSLQQQEVWGSILPSSLALERQIIKQAAVRNAISRAEKLTTDKVKRNSLIFFLEAHTLYKNSEYPQSFLSSWIIVENHIRGLWEAFLRDKDAPRKRTGKLFDKNYWDIDHILETLNLSGALTTKDYDLLMKFKKVRNDIVHSGYKASRKETEDCFQSALGITRELCEVH